MELSKYNIIDFEYNLIESLGFNGTKNYFFKNGVLLRIKNHTPDWDNFRSDLNDNDQIFKVVNVTVGDYENTDFRRNKADLIELKNDYPNIDFYDIKIADGEDLKEAIEKVKKILISNKINGMTKLKKGSAEAKRFMAKLRSMKGKTPSKPTIVKKSVSGWKKGSTKFVEAGEKKPKRNGVLVRRKKTGEHKGSFSKFRTISGVSNTDDSKKLRQLATQSKSPLFKKVASILISKYKNGGYPSLKSVLEDVQHGLQSGIISELIYYSDTIKWYKKYKKEIAKMLRDTMYEMGVDSPKDVFGKNWDDDDHFAEDTHNQNLLAWYSFEETARNIGYSLGYDI
jgi:hypothetical protein